jgi:hypothetical protein
MTTHTWIEIGGGLVLGIIALIAFFKLRAMRGKLTRQSLFLFVGQLVAWTLFGILFFSGLLAFFYFAAVAAIYVPIIAWILKLPKNEHVA